ncbi:MFS transporter [Peribacillus butanolivorans]|uniref:MFS transporter n=1 Tax=Peribacillus butanolivorans TaxID=421767 RepID=UPI002E1D8C4D|nr:MFS transporter [Peribacillus butanolivorans]MED3691255.1 MFS transporter [Peribacillus butanolivorans]
MKNQYFKAASGMYINYFLLGMVNIILASNMVALTEQWDTDSTGISYLIAAIGIGRLLTYGITGILSDRFGRKPLIIVSTIVMLFFLVGIPFSPTYEIAFVFALLAGVSNSAMDAGTYPALTEMFPKSASSASVMVKAFVSLGATVLPFIILFLSENNLFYGYAFLLPAVIYFLNMIFLFFTSFQKVQDGHNSKEDELQLSKFISEPKFWKEGLALIIIGFTSTALFTVSQIWLPSFGQEVAGMSASNSIKLLSYYSVGSLISVLLLSVLLKKLLKPVTVILLYPMITLIAVIVILTVHTPLVLSVTSFFLGASTAGIFQLTIAIMAELFWKKKGTVTGIVSTASSLASVVLPIATGLIAKSGDISHIFLFDCFIATLGILAAVFVNYRYKKLTKHPIILK